MTIASWILTSQLHHGLPNTPPTNTYQRRCETPALIVHSKARSNVSGEHLLFFAPFCSQRTTSTKIQPSAPHLFLHRCSTPCSSTNLSPQFAIRLTWTVHLGQCLRSGIARQGRVVPSNGSSRCRPDTHHYARGGDHIEPLFGASRASHTLWRRHFIGGARGGYSGWDQPGHVQIYQH